MTNSKNILFIGDDSDLNFYKLYKNERGYNINLSNMDIYRYETLNEAYITLFQNLNTSYDQLEREYEEFMNYDDNYKLHEKMKDTLYSINSIYLTSVIKNRFKDNKYKFIKFKDDNIIFIASLFLFNKYELSEYPRKRIRRNNVIF